METVLSVAHYSPEPSSPYVLYVCQSVRFFELVPRPSAQFTVTAPRSGGVGPMVGPGGASGGGWRVRWRVPLYIAAREAKFFVTCVGKKQFLCAAPQILAPWRPRAPDFSTPPTVPIRDFSPCCGVQAKMLKSVSWYPLTSLHRPTKKQKI